VTVPLVKGTQVLVPAGVCNGFQSVSPGISQYLYCFDAEWVPGMSGTAVNPLDPDLGIVWPLPVDGNDRRAGFGEGRRPTDAARRAGLGTRLPRGDGAGVLLQRVRIAGDDDQLASWIFRWHAEGVPVALDDEDGHGREVELVRCGCVGLARRCTGNASAMIAAALVAAAVRQATRAPLDRPQWTAGNPPS